MKKIKLQWEAIFLSLTTKMKKFKNIRLAMVSKDRQTLHIPIKTQSVSYNF